MMDPSAKSRPALPGSPQEALSAMLRVPGLRYGVLDDLLGYALRRAQNALYLDFHTATAAFNISPQRYAALVLIGENPGLKQGVLAEAMGIDRSGALRLVDWLGKRELVRRTRLADDGRAWGLALTERGEAERAAITEAVSQHDRRMMARVEPAAAELKSLLERLAG